MAVNWNEAVLSRILINMSASKTDIQHEQRYVPTCQLAMDTYPNTRMNQV